MSLVTFSGTSEYLDKLKWRLNSRWKFTVKSVYWNLNQKSHLNVLWPWKLIWRVKIPVKVSCFVWLVVRKACLTQEKL